MKMRILTDTEWDRLVNVTDGNDEKMHWKEISSRVFDSQAQYHFPGMEQGHRGYSSARVWWTGSAFKRDGRAGFRPAVEELGIDTIPSEGMSCVIGTLYMDGTPVKVPQNPVWNGDIENFIPGAKLEMREAVNDPAYQVTGIYIGEGVFIADRNLLKNISYDDIGLGIYNYDPRENGFIVAMRIFTDPCNHTPKADLAFANGSMTTIDWSKGPQLEMFAFGINEDTVVFDERIVGRTFKDYVG